MLLYYIFIRYGLIGIYGPNFFRFALHTHAMYLFVGWYFCWYAADAGTGAGAATVVDVMPFVYECAIVIDCPINTSRIARDCYIADRISKPIWLNRKYWHKRWNGIMAAAMAKGKKRTNTHAPGEHVRQGESEMMESPKIEMVSLSSERVRVCACAR